MLVRLVLLVGVAGVLTGCATRTKAPLPSNEYESFAQNLVGPRKCALAGMASIDEAAYGEEITRNKLSTWSFDSDQLRMYLNKWDSDSSATFITKTYCTQMVMTVSTFKRHAANSIAADNQNTQKSWEIPRTTQTYCNRIGTQTFCTSH